MATPVSPTPSEDRTQYWRRVLRPLFWWLLLVLVLFGIHTHQRLMEKTRLNFTATLAGHMPFPEDVATFDGQPAFSGQNIPLGNHQFTVTQPKGETFSTNLFVWYGAHNFGTIDLKRTMGILTVTANPPADYLVIRGPEWSVTLTNSAGLTRTVPTDVYGIEVRYPHWQKNYTAGVYANQTAFCTIAPHFGGLQLGCNQADATFQMQDADGQWVANGNLPATVDGLPAGVYRLTATHHGHQRTDALTVRPDTNTSAQLDFHYGKAVFATTPSGASVTTTDDGRSWGETPLTLSELLPGNWNFTLQRSGYQSVQLSVNVEADQDSFVTTNLVSQNYLHAMTTTRQFMAAADYNRALQSANEALDARAGDADALALQREATGLGLIQHAKILGQQGDYIGGGKELKQALQSLPDNAEAMQLVSDFKQHVPEQVERMRVERLARPKKVFDDTMASISAASAFESHELTTGKSAADAQLLIEMQLKTEQPYFKVLRSEMANEIFKITANQEFPGGIRQCEIVGGQSKDDETQIYFKVIEMKKAAFYNQPIGSFWHALPANYELINPNDPQLNDKQRQQITDGVALVTAKIQVALGQTPPAAVQPAVPQ